MMASFFIYQSDIHITAAKNHVDNAESAIHEAQVGVQNAINAAEILKYELHRIDKENATLEETQQTLFKEYADHAIDQDSLLLDFERRKAELLNQRNRIIQELEAYNMVAND